MSEVKMDDSILEPLTSVAEDSEQTPLELKSINMQTTSNAEQEPIYEKMSSVCSISANGDQEKFRRLEPSLDDMSQSSRNSMQSLPLSPDRSALASYSTEGSEMYEPVAVRITTLESAILAESPVYEPTTIPKDKSPAKVPRPDSKSSRRSSKPSSIVSSPVTANIGSGGSPMKHGSPAGAGHRSSASITSGILFQGNKIDPKFAEYQNDPRRKGLKVRSSPLYVNSPIFSPRCASEGSKKSSLDDVKRKALEEADSIDIDQDYNESRKTSSTDFLKKKEKMKKVMRARSPWQSIRNGSRTLKDKYIYDREHNPHHHLKVIGVVIILLIIIFGIVVAISLSYIRKRENYEVIFKTENFEVRSLKLAMPDVVSLGQPLKMTCFLGIVFLHPSKNDRKYDPNSTNPSSAAEKQPVMATAVSHMLIKLSLPTGGEIIVAELSPSPTPVLNHRPGFGVSGTSLSQARNKAELVAEFNRSSCLDQGSYTCEVVVPLEAEEKTMIHSLTKHLQVNECEKKEAVLSEMRADLKITPSVVSNKSMGGVVSMECSLAERFRPYLLWVDNITLLRKDREFVTIASLTGGENPMNFRNDTLDGSTSLLGKGPHLRFTWKHLHESDFGNYICTQSVHESVTHVTTITSPIKSLTTSCPNTEWTYVGSVCLRLYLVSVNWKTAEQGCVSEGGKLFGGISAAEYNWLKEYLNTQDVDRPVWVHVIKRDVKNTTQTGMDGQSACTAIAPQDNFELQSRDCGEKNGYVCTSTVGM